MKLSHTASLLFFSFALAPVAFAQSKPANPIIVSTSIGEIAGARGKVAMALAIGVQESGNVTELTIREDAMMGGSILLPVEHLAAIADALDASSEAILAGKSADGSHGPVRVYGDQGDSGKVVTIERDGGGMFGMTKISFDPDNAATAARLIRRANNNIAWLTPRIAPLNEK